MFINEQYPTKRTRVSDDYYQSPELLPVHKLLKLDNLSIQLDVAEANERFELILNHREQDGLLFIDFAIMAPEAMELPEAVLDFHFPIINMHNLWTPGVYGHPRALRNKGIPEWWPHFESQISQLAPICSFYSLEGENRMSFALSDSKESVKIHAGAYEEDRVARVRMRLFTERSIQRQEYKGTVRIDTGAKPFYEAIENMATWYEELLGNQQMQVPEAALEPVYSTWYSFHQNLSQQEIEDQCRMSSALGCKTVILDDGWQTDDNNRGYKFCGDWEVAESRFPQMREHVERVQAMGMKYMLWLSVPFIGQGCKIWDEFKDNLLFYSEQNQTGTLDPRYPKVREYLISTYCRVVKDYNLDGLKLDFIDEFEMARAEGKALEIDPARDTESLTDAVDTLMTGVRQALEAINPDILIEFRQRYIGPNIRKYGNMFRVHDCPNDSITNRMNIVDLRMFSGDTAVHSDMFIWTPEDTAESASLHFINTLFSVPQISPDMKELSEEHTTMTGHWLGFWRENRDLLLKGRLKSSNPELQYPLIESQLGDRKIVTVHANLMTEVFNSGEKELLLVNGAMTDSLYIKLPESINAEVTVFDCLGNEVRKETTTLDQGLHELALPKSGYARICKQG